MAELLIAQGWTPPDKIALRLREDLPEDVFVVVGATLCGSEFDVIIVSNCGLIVVYLLALRFNISAPVESMGQPENFHQEAVEHSERALDQFMQDEFPALRPAVRHLLVGIDEIDGSANTEIAALSAVPEEQMVDAISAAFDPDSPQYLDRRQCSDLAQAFSERRLTVRQRASAPFVFRTGDFRGRGKTVWTIQEAVRHMDRHPDDGIYHLRNGTFVRWLQDQGAGHVAAMANGALHEVTSSPREMLEIFLIETGQVDRPSIVFRPKAVDIGPIQAGTSGLGHLDIRQGRGRGYLFGQLATVEPWMNVTPSTFNGSRTVVSINVDTGSLPISREPYKTFVDVMSSSDKHVLRVPVCFKIVGVVPVMQTLLLRPLAALLMAGMIGFSIGWMLGLTQPLLSLNLWPGNGLDAPISTRFLLAILVGAFWAFLGIVVGLQMPDTWPLFAATRYWFSRTVLWLLGLFTLGAGACLVIGRFSGILVLDGLYEDCITVGLAAAAFALLPVAIRGMHLTNDSVGPTQSMQGPVNRRNLVAVSVALLLFAIIIVGIRQRDSLAILKDISQQGMEAGLTDVDVRLQRWGDELVIRYYDRRAPSRANSESAASTNLMTTTLMTTTLMTTTLMTTTVVPGPTPPMGPDFP